MKRKIIILISIWVISTLLLSNIWSEVLSDNEKNSEEQIDITIGVKKVIPPQIYLYIEKNLDRKFSDAAEKTEYIEGFSEGFKSSLVYKSYSETWTGSKMRDEGFKAGRKIGLTELLPDGLKDISLTDYGFIDGDAEGFLYFAFEQSDFRPIDSDEIWWVLNSDVVSRHSSKYNEIRKRINIDKNYDKFAIYAKIKGYFSPESSRGYGHMGRYNREIYIVEVLEIRKSTDNDKNKRKE